MAELSAGGLLGPMDPTHALNQGKNLPSPLLCPSEVKWDKIGLC